ncbi:MAG TPA: DUF5682 family protein [Nocardioidaceae bacterium]|nr:DUF5682 family protein [Nocardioidaceae bacterium]
MSASSVTVLGIRHHGPGSARSVATALDELSPDCVVIEGPPELDALVPLAAHPELVPPVAGLVYAVDSPRRAAFYPFAVFSPEWVALQWALARGVEVRFADLPGMHVLAPDKEEGQSDDRGDRASDADDVDSGEVQGSEPDGGARQRTALRLDPVGELARTAGYDDPERWWEDAIEHRRDSTLERFAMLSEAIAAVRERAPEEAENARREAAMRRVLRAVQRAGRERVAMVCGAWHAPALEEKSWPTQAADNRLLAKLPKTKVAATWAPWTAGRLAMSSGYGAGVRSPGWYRHLFTTPDEDVVAGWLVQVARALREEGLDAAPASVVEATRLADALAAVRGRPSVGLSELDDATRAVLAEGSDLPLALIDRKLVIGEELGRVPDETPMVPLAADVARQQRSLRLKPSATSSVVQLDLRRDGGLARSVFLHRLRVLGIDWAEQVSAGTTTGTFKEAWELEWRPELAVALVEASLYGNTVLAAAEASVGEQAGAADLAGLAMLVEDCFLADLSSALPDVVAVLAERTARQHDTLTLLRTVEPLARTCRYGDVRGADTAGIAHVLETVVVRASLGLRAACQSLDDDGAAAVRGGIEGTQRGVALLDDAALTDPWHAALTRLGDDVAIHGSVSGRLNRLLLDADLLASDEAARRLSRRLSVGADAEAGAAWLDGFLTGEALLLLHDDDLLGVVDEWVASVPEQVFEDLLPLLRRTFSRFESAERRQIGAHLRDLGTARPEVPSTGIELERGRPAAELVARLLGLEVAS